MRLIPIFALLFSTLSLAAPNHQVFDSKGNVFYTGRIPNPVGHVAMAPSPEFLLRDAKYPQTLNRDLGKLGPVINQANCGSCVYFATTATWADTMILRGMPYIATSPQYLMDCAERRWMCSGSIFEYVAAGLVAKGGSALMSEYPYKAKDQACQGSPTVHGKALAYRIIDRSHKSIIAALNDRRAVAVTIGAGGAYMNYKSGVFSSCSNVSTNHEVSLVDYNCESSVDKDGNCVFDAQGNLPKGVGYWVQRNSWGVGWGDKGFIKIKMTTSSGARCNNIAEEAGIIDVGDPIPPPPPPGPENFNMESKTIFIEVSIPKGSPLTSAKVKPTFQSVLNVFK